MRNGRKVRTSSPLFFLIRGFRQQRGLTVVGWLLMVPVIFVALLILAVGLYEGRKAYWDHKVREMCEKDGGVKIYEHVRIRQGQARTMQKIGGYISIPPVSSATERDVLAWDESITVFREANPRVWRSEQRVRPVGDGKVVARIVRYSRVGGDFPLPAATSSAGCPEEKDVLAQREKIFLISK